MCIRRNQERRKPFQRHRPGAVKGQTRGGKTPNRACRVGEAFHLGEGQRRLTLGNMRTFVGQNFGQNVGNCQRHVLCPSVGNGHQLSQRRFCQSSVDGLARLCNPYFQVRSFFGNH